MNIFEGAMVSVMIEDGTVLQELGKVVRCVPVPNITKGIMTEAEIKDLTLRVANKIKAPDFTSRKQIIFKKKGSGTSTAYYHKWGKSEIAYSDDMLQEGNVHYKRHTIIHEVCHIVAECKYGVRTYHNINFVREEMRAHEMFGYKTYYPATGDGYIVALKELSTGDWVYVKHNYEIKDGKPVIKIEIAKNRKAMQDNNQRSYVADEIKLVRKEFKGAKVHTVIVAKTGLRGHRLMTLYFKHEGVEKKHEWACYGMTSIFPKATVSKERQSVGVMYEWKRKSLTK